LIEVDRTKPCVAALACDVDEPSGDEAKATKGAAVSSKRKHNRSIRRRFTLDWQTAEWLDELVQAELDERASPAHSTPEQVLQALVNAEYRRRVQAALDAGRRAAKQLQGNQHDPPAIRAQSPTCESTET
jgi:hypothetical protein